MGIHQTADLVTTQEKSTIINALFDNATKVLAIAVVLVYAYGYLIWALFNNIYGFEDDTILRPRTASAGVLALLLTALPIVSDKFLMAIPLPLMRANKQNLTTISRLYRYIAISLFISPVAEMLSTPLPYTMRMDTAIVVLFFIGMAASLIKLQNRALATISYGGAVIYFGIACFLCYRMTREGLQLRAAYFAYSVLVCLITTAALEVRRAICHAREMSTAKPEAILAFLIIAGLVVGPYGYAAFIFPHVKRAWGGGLMNTIQVQTSPHAFLYPGTIHQFKLVDETDQGYYLYDPAKGMTCFIPRNQVDGIYFGEHPSTTSDMPKNKP